MGARGQGTRLANGAQARRAMPLVACVDSRLTSRPLRISAADVHAKEHGLEATSAMRLPDVVRCPKQQALPSVSAWSFVQYACGRGTAGCRRVR